MFIGTAYFFCFFFVLVITARLSGFWSGQLVLVGVLATTLAAPQFGLSPRGGAPVIVNFGLQRSHPDQPELIVRQTQTHGPDGTYSYDVELERGTRFNEQGYLKNPGTQAEAQSAQGSFSYVGPDGQTYSVSYIADENGFQPQGAHLPTPPPIPEELERAYALARADPDYREIDEPWLVIYCV